MPRQTFGLTWWGQQWLQALTHIDYDNRLPRGRAYANKGAVKHLTVTGGEIHAKVQGSRPHPYVVSLNVPALTLGDAARLLDGIAGDPALIARLLNKELDPDVLELARKLGIAVFPTRWQDLGMHCSCPDWAVPCKHLAAVIYVLSREIDADPSRLFALRGVDLVAALKVRDIHIDAQIATSLPSVADLLQRHKQPAPRASGENTNNPDPLAPLDFSALPDLTETLLRVLPARPAFSSPDDFREVLQRTQHQVAKSARRELDGPRVRATKDRSVGVRLQPQRKRSFKRQARAVLRPLNAFLPHVLRRLPWSHGPTGADPDAKGPPPSFDFLQRSPWATTMNGRNVAIGVRGAKVATKILH